MILADHTQTDRLTDAQDSIQAVADLYEHRLLAFLKALAAESEGKRSLSGRFLIDLRKKLDFMREHEKVRREHVFAIARETAERVTGATIGDDALRTVGAHLALAFDEAKTLAALAERLRVYDNKSPVGLLKNLLHSKKTVNDPHIIEILREIAFWARPARVEEQLGTNLSPLEKILDASEDQNAACYRAQYAAMANLMRECLEGLWNGGDTAAAIAEQQALNEEFDAFLSQKPVAEPVIADDESKIIVTARSSHKTLFLASVSRLDVVTMYPFTFDELKKVYAIACADALASDEDGVIRRNGKELRFIYPVEISEHFARICPPVSLIRDRALSHDDYVSRDGKLIVHPGFSADIRNVLVLSCAEKRLQTLEEAAEHPDARLFHLSPYSAVDDEIRVQLNAGVQNITLIGLSSEGIERVFIPEVYVGERYKVNCKIEGEPSPRKETVLKVRFELESNDLFSAPTCYRLPEMELRMSHSGLTRKEDGEILCYVDEVALERTPAGRYEKLVLLSVPKTPYPNARIRLFFRNDTDAYLLVDVR